MKDQTRIAPFAVSDVLKNKHIAIVGDHPLLSREAFIALIASAGGRVAEGWTADALVLAAEPDVAVCDTIRQACLNGVPLLPRDAFAAVLEGHCSLATAIRCHRIKPVYHPDPSGERGRWVLPTLPQTSPLNDPFQCDMDALAKRYASHAMQIGF